MQHFRVKITSIIALFILSMFLITACSDDNCVNPAGEDQQVVIGGLFSLTGNWQTLGVNSKAALELAVEDLHAKFANSANPIQITAAIEDTELEPQLALAKLQSLKAQGAMIVIGPQSSSEVAQVKDYADQNGVVVISQSSTAGTLAQPDDNIFRFTPSDQVEGEAVVALMQQDGLQAVIPVYRDDAGNEGLFNSVKEKFSVVGAVLPEIKYATSGADFAQVASTLNDMVTDAVSQYGAENVGVYLAAFDEVVAVFKAADNHDALHSIKWYGSDGVAQSDALIGDAEAAAFAASVDYPNPIMGVDPSASEIWEPLKARIQAKTGIEPDAFALAVYDAAWIATFAHLDGGADADASVLAKQIQIISANHFGANGWAVLNEAGDKKHGNFDFWAVREVNGQHKWVVSDRYETYTKSVSNVTD